MPARPAALGDGRREICVNAGSGRRGRRGDAPGGPGKGVPGRAATTGLVDFM